MDIQVPHFTAGAGRCQVRSIYPYVVRAIDSVLQLNDLQMTYKHWQRLSDEDKEHWLEEPRIRERMVELAEQDAQGC